jgi:hypothetical protein
MLATELLFVCVYCLVDDAIKAGALLIPRRPGPAPACTDPELLTIALVRHLLGRRSENGFLAEIRRGWLHLFPHLPHQSEVNRAGLVDRARCGQRAGGGCRSGLRRRRHDRCPAFGQGFNGSAFAAQMATAGINVIIPPTRAQRRTMPKPVQRLIANFRKRVEVSFKEITDQMELARHGAHCFEGLLTRTAATLAAHALLLTVLPDQG